MHGKSMHRKEATQAMIAGIKPIMLAEDNPKDVELTLAALEKHRLANQVVVVRDGEQALDYLFKRGAWAGREGGPPAVMLLDLKMPKVDGLEVLRAVKQDENLRVLPIVVLTSSREECDLVKSYRLGANAYVVKPVQFDAFMAAIDELGSFWAIVNEPPPGCTSLR